MARGCSRDWAFPGHSCFASGADSQKRDARTGPTRAGRGSIPAMRDAFRSPGFWALALGGVGGAAGFFGPIALNPDANQGPLLGILITGPGGAIAGLVLGFLFRILPIADTFRAQMLTLCCASLGLGTLWYRVAGTRGEGARHRRRHHRLPDRFGSHARADRALGRAHRRGDLGAASRPLAGRYAAHAARDPGSGGRDRGRTQQRDPRTPQALESRQALGRRAGSG